MALKVLISDDDYKFNKTIAETLSEGKFEIYSAVNGKFAQIQLYLYKFFVIILNFYTKNHSGIEVLKYARLTSPSLRIILVFNSQKRFNDVEMSRSELLKLGATDILIKPCDPKLFLNAIENLQQFDFFKPNESKEVRAEEEVSANDSEFTFILKQDFMSASSVTFDTYVRLGANKYIKILHRGDYFDHQRLKVYADNDKVEHFYFKTKDRAVYVSFLNTVLEKALANEKIGTDVKFGISKNLTQKYVEEIYTSGLKPHLVEEGMKTCDNLISLTMKNKDLRHSIKEFEETCPTTYSHSFLVSLFSCMIGKHIDWITSQTLKSIVMASFLHDIGKLKLPPALREKKVDDMTKEEELEYRKHPTYGYRLLGESPLLEEKVKQIVYQHHEYINGTGFPSALTSMKIYPPARVVSFANSFADFITTNQLPPLDGLKLFIPDLDLTKKHDPLIIKAFAKSFSKEG
jgi:response regulator RpfG family c-di-GMP phosphodiesterase